MNSYDDKTNEFRSSMPNSVSLIDLSLFLKYILHNYTLLIVSTYQRGTASMA